MHRILLLQSGWLWLTASFSTYLPISSMGQYFKAVNLDKREVVCPWCLQGGAKLWEWAASPYGAVFTLLLRKSSGTGGGDYNSPGPLAVDMSEPNQDLVYLIGKAAAREGMPAPIPASSVVGRWAGDRVWLLGDYDESKIWDELPSYTNITEQLVREWNDFTDLPEVKLEFKHCGCGTTQP